jgi:hypothetical protein
MNNTDMFLNLLKGELIIKENKYQFFPTGIAVCFADNTIYHSQDFTLTHTIKTYLRSILESHPNAVPAILTHCFNSLGYISKTRVK